MLMKEDEIKMFEDVVRNCGFYFEFGCGGSTFRACELGAKKIVSVESQKMWIDEIKQYEQVKVHPDITFLAIDINAGDMGRPINNTKQNNFPLYSSAIDNYKNIDVVLVDGRFRVACACKAVINRVQSILIHDFTNRAHYHDILPYIEIIKQTGTLIQARPKSDINMQDLEKLYENYKLNPS